MKKTFKKPLALALAVLMLLTSIPFTALALPGDYEPNIKLLFGTAGNMISNGLMVGEGAYDAPTGKNQDALDNMAFIGLYGAPLDFNYTKSGDKSTGETVSGKLSLSPSKAQGYIDFLNDPSGNDLGVSNITSKTTLGVGDYFVVTVVAENVKAVKNLDTRFEYSANIEPAGIYGSGTNTKKNYQYRALSEVTSNDKYEGQNAAEPLSGQCSDAFYSTINEVAGDTSEFFADANRFHTQAVGSIDATDVSTTTAPEGQTFFDQTTGAAIATLPADTMVLESYMFKIVGDGDISFTMLPDEDGSKTNGYYIANKNDGVAIADYTTYSPNGTNPGSEKMTFMAGAAPAPVACYDINVKSGFTNGTVTMDGVTVDPATGATKNVEVNTKVTLVATPDEGAKFLGWKANGVTTVSTEATLEAFVNANVTYTPVFAKASEGQIILTFVDASDNIVDVKVITKGDTSFVPPEVPARAGYTANGWSVTDFAALTEDTVVTAKYIKNADEYTVTVPAGSTITINGVDQEGTTVSVPYNTQVTVYNASATSWKINGATVAYGNTYTFYVGADVELTIDTAAVAEETPVVGSVGIEANGTRVSFLATRKIETKAGCVQVNAGFIYGTTGVTASTELVDVNGTSVKAVYTKTDSEQYSISFTVTPGKTYNGKAFITYKNAADEIHVAYANLQSYSA